MRAAVRNELAAEALRSGGFVPAAELQVKYGLSDAAVRSFAARRKVPAAQVGGAYWFDAKAFDHARTKARKPQGAAAMALAVKHGTVGAMSRDELRAMLVEVVREVLA